MSKQAMAKAFNEWMRRYHEEPERFEREFQTVEAFVRDEAKGAEPAYGQECAAYLLQIMGEQEAAEGPPETGV